MALRVPLLLLTLILILMHFGSFATVRTHRVNKPSQNDDQCNANSQPYPQTQPEIIGSLLLLYDRALYVEDSVFAVTNGAAGMLG